MRWIGLDAPFDSKGYYKDVYGVSWYKNTSGRKPFTHPCSDWRPGIPPRREAEMQKAVQERKRYYQDHPELVPPGLTPGKLASLYHQNETVAAMTLESSRKRNDWLKEDMEDEKQYYDEFLRVNRFLLNRYEAIRKDYNSGARNLFRNLEPIDQNMISSSKPEWVAWRENGGMPPNLKYVYQKQRAARDRERWMKHLENDPFEAEKLKRELDVKRERDTMSGGAYSRIFKNDASNQNRASSNRIYPSFDFDGSSSEKSGGNQDFSF